MRLFFTVAVSSALSAAAFAAPSASDPLPETGVRLSILEESWPQWCIPTAPEGKAVKKKAREPLALAWSALENQDAAGAAGFMEIVKGDHPTVVATNALTKILAGDMEGGMVLQDALIAERPNDPCALLSSAMVDTVTGNNERARTRAEAAFAAAPNDPEVALLYSMAVIPTDIELAIERLFKAYEQHPQHGRLAFAAGYVRLSRGDAAGALTALTVAEAQGFEVGDAMMEASFATGDVGAYVKLASARGLPLGDGGKLASAADPLKAFDELVGAPAGAVLFAVIDTTMGDLRCELLHREAPVTVGNFVGLARGTQPWQDPGGSGPQTGRFYDGTVLHRVIPDFMIQMGDPLGNGTGGPGYQFPDEIAPDRSFDRSGLLAMANAGPATNGSQFFITEVPTPHLTGKHTIFGVCDDATVEVVKAIARVERDGNDKPVSDVKIEAIRFEAVPIGGVPAAPPSAPDAPAPATPAPATP